MTKYENKFGGGVSSRLKNDLLENQAWWPVTLKSDGNFGYLTVDPTLFASDINPADELLLFTGQEVAHESQYPGIRVEYLKTNASKSAVVTGEGTCTLAVTGSGTWSAQIQITWPDSTTTTIPLVAQGHAGQFDASERYDAFEELEKASKSLGPSPVPMTMQELADILDSFTKRTGDYAAETPSGRTWNPHPNEHIYLPADSYNVAPTYSSISALANYLGNETNAQIAATVFMPMVANMNQYSRNMAAECGTTFHELEDMPVSGFSTTDAEVIPRVDGKGMDRFDPDPEGEDAASVLYGFANQSGDHKFGHRRFGSAAVKTLQHENGADTTTSPNPKWRTRMCLAMFLKDGTYTISGGGALIPYVYDPRREIGGEHFKRNRGQHAAQGLYLGGDGLYGVWSPAARSSESVATNRYANAMISPGIDFVQGPFSPPSIGWNYEPSEDVNALSGEQLEGGYSFGSYNIYAYDSIHAINALPVPVYAVEFDDSGLDLDFYVDVDDIVATNRLAAGNYVYVDLLEGNLGWNSSSKNANGWWKIASTTQGSDSDSPSGTALQIRVDCGFSGDVAKYLTPGARIRMGRPQPKRILSPTYLPDGYGGWHNGGHGPGQKNHTNSVFGTVDDLIPGIGDHSSAGSYSTLSQSGLDVDNEFTEFQRRQVHITGSVTDYPEDTQDEANPTPSLTGGVGIRIPPQMGDSGHTDTAVSSTSSTGEYYQWFTKSLLLTMWSGIDQASGRHSWDYIRPKDSSGNQWIKGRNRAWPGMLRGDTQMGAPPNIRDLRSLYTDALLDQFDPDARYGIPTDKYGLTEWGVSALYADIELSAYIPVEKDRITKIWFERGNTTVSKHGYRSFHHGGGAAPSSGNMAGRKGPQGWGHYPVTTDTSIPSGTVNGVFHKFYYNQYTLAEAWWWVYGGSDVFEDPDIKTEIEADGATLPFHGLRTGWGNAGDHIGSGGYGTSFADGLHTLRFAFFRDRLIHEMDGSEQGEDMGSQGPIYGFTFEHGALHKNDPAITKNIHKNLVNKTGKDPVINSIKVREIPTAAMLPFKAETVTYNISGVAKYRELFIVGRNMTADQYVRISICAPGSTTGSWDGFGQEPGTPYTGFSDLDPEWVGGFAAVDLTSLPAAAISNGFTIRFEWTTKTASHGKDGVIDWAAMPEITEYSIDYDLTPTTTFQVTAESYNGDTSSPIDTRVGHIVSFRVTGNTTDVDRKVGSVKFDYGDGTVTDWISVSEAASAITYDINHSYVSTASGLVARAKVRDDNLNESDWSSTITVNVANAPPVAVLRASPSMVRAGDSVRLDATRSYDIEDGGTVTDFSFTPGDGSSVVGPQSQTYTNHTYATAGEYLATVTCKDGAGTSSNTAKAVIKVLPARLTVPLVLNTMPSSFSRSRTADYTITPLLDSDFPEVSDTGQRMDDFTLSGIFLHATAELDIDFMEDLLATGHLVEFEWMSVNYSGTPDSRTFVGRVIAFSYNREGGSVGQTPWSATLIREAGVGE